jgi:hypothetical protein
LLVNKARVFAGCGIIFAQMSDKERKQGLNIPGVQRGADFFRGVAVEMAGQKSASRRRVEYGEAILDLYLIKTRNAGYLNLPVLGRDEGNSKSAAFWEPRVDPTDGSVITWRWESQKTETRDFADCIPLAGKKINAKFNYSQVPQEWKIGMLTPQKVKEGIEAAMRQQDEIIHDYGKDMGSEVTRVSTTFDLLYDASSAFIMGDVRSEKDLEELANTVEAHFKDHGLLESDDSVWQKVVGYTLKAAEKDKLNRINPLVSRIRVRAAFIAGTEKEMVVKSVGTKAEKVYRQLEIVRAGTRLKIRTAIEVLDSLCGFSKGVVATDIIMREGNSTCTAKEGWETEQYLKTVSEDILRGIQPAPYLIPVTSARIILIGENSFKNKNESVIGMNLLKGTDSFIHLDNFASRMLKNRNPQAARRIIFKAYSKLNEILGDPKTTNIRVFDK